MHAPEFDFIEPPPGKHWLVFIRHSLPEITPGIPPQQWPLSDIGRQRCKPLARELRAYGLQRIFSSTEPKAMETAHLLSQYLALPYQPFAGLHEHPRRGDLKFNEADFQEDVAAFFAQPERLVFGEETARQSRERFLNAVYTLLDRYPDQNLGISAHGTVITLFISHACGIDPFPFWQRLGLPSLVVLTQPSLSLHSVLERIA